MIDNWSKNKKRYKLDKKIEIIKACEKEFSVYESVYGDGIYNRFAIKNWDLRLAISLDTPFAKKDSYYWIVKNNIRVGGGLIEPNLISRLFIIPPYNDLYGVLKLLKKLLIKWSDPSKNIYAFQINNEQKNYLEMLGFWKEKSRRWMMRPTKKMDYKYIKGFDYKSPQKNQSEEITKLIYSSFSNGVDKKSQLFKISEKDLYKRHLDEVNDFFENTNDFLLKASTVIYDSNDKKIVGVCLISMFEKWPLIHTIAVEPSYFGKGLGKMMLAKGMSILHKKYQIVRLFVTIGNAAESLYHDLGFVQGVEFGKYYLSNFDK